MNNVDRVLTMCRNVITCSDDSELVHIVLTGGKVGSAITQRLREVATTVPETAWERVHLWWGDERFVPYDSDQRNDFGIESILGDLYSEDRVHRVRGREPGLDANSSAQEYAHQLLRFGSSGPKFSLVILGMGPDGHIASLFPYSQQLRDTALCVAVTDSPKPPLERITMTFTALNNSSVTVILAEGLEKKLALKHLMDHTGSIEQTPARGITAPVLEILD